MVFTTDGIRRALISHSAKLVDRKKDIKLELLKIAELMLLSGDQERYKRIPSLGIKEWAAIAYYWAATINEWRASDGFNCIVVEASTLLFEVLDAYIEDEAYFNSCLEVSKLFADNRNELDGDPHIDAAYDLYIAEMGPIVLLAEEIEAFPWSERFLLTSIVEDIKWQKAVDKRLLFASHLEDVTRSLFDDLFQCWDDLDDASKDVLEAFQEMHSSLYLIRKVDLYQRQVANIERWLWNFALPNALDAFIAEMNALEVPTRLASKDELDQFHLLDHDSENTHSITDMPLFEPILYGQLPASLDIALSCLDRFSIFTMLLHNIYGLDERENVDEIEEINQHLGAEDLRIVLKDLILMNFSSYLTDNLGLLSDGLLKLAYGNGRLRTKEELLDEIDLIRQGFVFCVIQDSGSRLFLPKECHEILIQYIEQQEQERDSLSLG